MHYPILYWARMDENLYDEFGVYIGPEIDDFNDEIFSDEDVDRADNHQTNSIEQGTLFNVLWS